jgi:hypothetical protein
MAWPSLGDINLLTYVPLTGLDIVPRRKSQNAVAGMVLVSHAAYSTWHAQMDLARAEAAKVLIHSFGCGRSQDRLMSNHSGRKYTFVSDWYDLRRPSYGGGASFCMCVVQPAHTTLWPDSTTPPHAPVCSLPRA